MKIEVIVLAIGAILFHSCWGKEDGQKNSRSLILALESYLQAHHIEGIENYSGIFVIGDGGCVNCNRLFSAKVSDWLELDDFLWIVASSGVKTDISQFIVNENPKVIWDRSNEFGALGFFQGSGFIALNRGEIDSLVLMSADRIESRLKFVEDFVRKSQAPPNYLKSDFNSDDSID
jgi:hypothetical protein